jgi:hypothetical protein
LRDNTNLSPPLRYRLGGTDERASATASTQIGKEREPFFPEEEGMGRTEVRACLAPRAQLLIEARHHYEDGLSPFPSDGKERVHVGFVCIAIKKLNGTFQGQREIDSY